MSSKKETTLPKRKKKWTRDDTELTFLGIPTFIWYVCFCYLPMFGIIIAFKNYKMKVGQGFFANLMTSKWAGFKNFEFFLKSGNFKLLLKNTIGYNIIFIILGILLPVTLAIMISLIHSKFKSKVYQTMMFLPHFMSWVVVTYFVIAFLDTDKGLINNIIESFGGERINFYTEPKFWPGIFVFMRQWKGVGYGMVVYLASITGIDGSLYEAAVIDGATKWQQVKYITLPSLKSIVIMMFILSIGGIFYSDFGLFYQLTRGASGSLYEVSNTFDVYIYNTLLGGGDLGRLAATSLTQSVACCCTILITNYIVKKIDKDQAII
ncbi:MAG: ABC transporter permease [Catonella sp.]|uniref:ABC transporter permease n=1 Tax=Catonella sp. TaxID=2382125 RepID=UPI003FA06CF4